MATVAEAEEALRARLAFKIPGPPVKPYPNDPKLYKMFHPKWELLVVYRGGDFFPPRQTGLAVQERLLPFEISILVRDLVGHQGGYTLLEAVRAALQGWKPLPDCAPMWILRDAFLNVDAGQWYWAVFAATKTTALPVLDDAPDAPFSQFSVQSPDGLVRFP